MGPGNHAAVRLWGLASGRPPSVHGPFERERVQERDGVLVAVDCEVAVVEVDHRDARAHEPREGEHRDAGAEREGGVGVAQVVEVAQRFDPDGSLGGLPLAAVEVAEVEMATAGVREQQRAVVPQRELVERLERDRLQRYRASAQPGLGVLDPSVRIRASDLDDAGGAINVALLEREQLRGSKSGRGREHDHRSERRPELLGHRPDLGPGIERPLLPARAASGASPR
jgi:hypothetical protein